MLIDCPECHKEVSTEAKNCPHCGYPLKKPRMSRRLRFLLGVLAAVIVGTYGYRESISQIVVNMWTEPEWTLSVWKLRLLEPFCQHEDLAEEDDLAAMPIQILAPAQILPQSQDGAMKQRTTTNEEQMVGIRQREEMMTRRQLERLANRIEAYYSVRKELPPDFESVAWSAGLIESFRRLGSVMRDGWGNAIRYQVSEGRVELASNGPDGVEGTEDDLLWLRQFEGAIVGMPMRKISRRDLAKFREAYYSQVRSGGVRPRAR